MLRVVISLVNQKELSRFSVMVIGFVALVVVLNYHRTELLEGLKHALELLDWVGDNIYIFIFVSVFIVYHFI